MTLIKSLVLGATLLVLPFVSLGARAGDSVAAPPSPEAPAEDRGAADAASAIRVDGAFGIGQVGVPAHQLRTRYTAPPAVHANAPEGGATSQWGFAAQGGLKVNLPNLSDADAMFLQATYARGPSVFPAINGQPTLGVNDFGRAGLAVPPLSPAPGATYDFDCALANKPSDRCDKSTGYALIAAFKHFWTPTVSSSLFASFFGMNYSDPAQFNPATKTDAKDSGNSLSIQPPLTWTPLKNLLVGSEAPWSQGAAPQAPATPGKPAAPPAAAPSPANPAAPWPAAGEWSGRIRVQRSF